MRTISPADVGFVLVLSAGAVLMALSPKIALLIPPGSASGGPVLLLWWAMLVAGVLAIGRHTKGKAVPARALWWVLFMLSVRPSLTSDQHLLDNLTVSATASFLSSPQALVTQSLTLVALALIVYGAAHARRLHPAWCSVQRGAALAMRLPAAVFVSALALLLVAIAVFLSWYCYRFWPSIPDTGEQYMHAKMMAQGEWYGYAPVLAWKGYFPTHLRIEPDGKWYSQYQPFHIFLISLGHRISAPWLVDPVGAGLTLVAVYALARRIYDEVTARVAASLVVCSPLILFMSSEYMSHVTAQLGCVLVVLGYVEMVEAARTGRRRRAHLFAIATGLAISAVFLSRPLVCLGIALPVVAHGLATVVREPRRHVAPFIMTAAAGLPGLMAQLSYNHLLTGNALLLPYIQRNKENIPGFSPSEGLTVVFSKMLMEWNQMNVMLFDWLAPSTLFAVVALLAASRRYALLLLASVLSLTLVNMANPFSSFTWGPRYLYEAAGFLIVLTAAGMVRLPQVLERRWPAVRDLRVLQGVSIVAVLCLFASGWPYHLVEDLARYAHNYQHNNHAFYASMLRQAPKPALVFVERGHYQHVAMINPADEREPVVFAVNQGRDRNCRLINAMPGRRAYIEQRSRVTPAESCAALPPGPGGSSPPS